MRGCGVCGEVVGARVEGHGSTCRSSPRRCETSMQEIRT